MHIYTKTHNKTTREGFTLFEIVLYLGLTTFMLVIVTSFIGLLMNSRIQNIARATVVEEGMSTLQMILYYIRDAEDVVSPVPGAQSGTLVVAAYDPNKNPTRISIDENMIVVSEGGGNDVALTSSNVRISNFIVENLSGTDTRGTIRIQFTIEYKNEDNIRTYQFAKTFYGSATLR